VLVEDASAHIHPVANDIDRDVTGEEMRDAPAPDRMWTDRFRASAEWSF